MLEDYKLSSPLYSSTSKGTTWRTTFASDYSLRWSAWGVQAPRGNVNLLFDQLKEIGFDAILQIFKKLTRLKVGTESAASRPMSWPTPGRVHSWSGRFSVEA